jgi:hypothetical protein
MGTLCTTNPRTRTRRRRPCRLHANNLRLNYDFGIGIPPFRTSMRWRSARSGSTSSCRRLAWKDVLFGSADLSYETPPGLRIRRPCRRPRLNDQPNPGVGTDRRSNPGPGPPRSLSQLFCDPVSSSATPDHDQLRSQQRIASEVPYQRRAQPSMDRYSICRGQAKAAMAPPTYRTACRSTG